VLSRFSDPNDDQVADEIYRELHGCGPDEKTASYIRSEIEALRRAVRAAQETPRPNDAKEQFERAARLAGDLASCLDDLGSEWRSYLRLMVFQERDDGPCENSGPLARPVPVLGAGPTAKAWARMDAWRLDLERLHVWMVDLERLRHELLHAQPLPRDFLSKPTKLCALAMSQIIWRIAPDMVLKKSMPFYRPTLRLWRAVSGDTGSDGKKDSIAPVKRACDDVVDLIRRMTRSAE
jgi:hypothetical protein